MCAVRGDDGRFSKGENLTVGEASNIALPSKQKVGLSPEIEFTGTRPGRSTPRLAEAHAGVGTTESITP